VLLLSLLLAALGGLWPAVRLAQRLGGRVTAMLQFAQAVATDRDPPPLSPARADALGELEANLVAMGRTVRERLRAVREEEHKLRAVLGGMVEGVVVISGEGRIVLLNDRARTIFALAPTPALAMTGVAAAALHDLGCTPAQGEMLYLLLRLPGAAVHALEQKDYGHKNFPFFCIELENDPGPAQDKSDRVEAAT
jgi:PAS domain-containing protein